MVGGIRGSSELIRLDTPPIPIRCAYNSDQFDALYNPAVGINIMSKAFAHKLFGKLILTPTTKFIKDSSGQLVHSLGILNVLPFMVEGSMVHLNFYIFDTWDFDLLIGQPFRKLLYEGQTEKLHISFGKDFIFPITISHSLNNKTESYLLPDPMEEVKATSLELLNEPNLEKEAPFFIEEDAEPSEPEPLDEFAETPKPPIELKPLPPGLTYAFLNNNLEFPIIMSDKLTQEQTLRLMTVLEKHHSVFGYSLQDLKGISPMIWTHRIPTDPSVSPSREPQRRLNNAMREVVKKEVTKLLHAGIIYPMPHNEWVSPVQVVRKKGGTTVVMNE